MCLNSKLIILVWKIITSAFITFCFYPFLLLYQLINRSSLIQASCFALEAISSILFIGFFKKSYLMTPPCVSFFDWLETRKSTGMGFSGVSFPSDHFSTLKMHLWQTMGTSFLGRNNLSHTKHLIWGWSGGLVYFELTLWVREEENGFESWCGYTYKDVKLDWK